MKIKLNKEQVAYLNGLSDAETKKQFLLDCFIKQCEASLEKESETIVFKDGIFKTSNPETIRCMNAMYNDGDTPEKHITVNNPESGTYIQKHKGTTTFVFEKTNKGREKFDKFIEDNGLKKFNPSKTKDIKEYIMEYVGRPVLSPESFSEEIKKYSDFYSNELFKEFIEHKPTHPDDVKKYSLNDLKKAFGKGRIKKFNGKFHYSSFEDFFKTLQ